MAVMSPEAGIDAVARSPAVRTVPAGRLLAATRMVTFLADDWKTAPATAAHTSTRATPSPICHGRRWWVVDEIRSPPDRLSPVGGGVVKVERVGAVVTAMETPVPQLLTDSIWATSREVAPRVVRLGRAPADPSGPAQVTVQVMVAVMGKAASFGLPSGEGWPAEVVA